MSLMTGSSSMGRWARLLAALAAILTISAVATSPALAQVDPGDADPNSFAEGEETCVFVDMDDTRLLAKADGVAYTELVAVDIPAGTVRIPAARAYDGYPKREKNKPQTSERYEIQFLDASGNVVGTSQPTEDLEDLVEEAEWIGSLGTVTLSAPAVAVRAHHRNDLPADGSPDSVEATGFFYCYVAGVPCPLDVNGDPLNPSDPDCAPAECPLDSDGNPVDPSDPDCPTAPECPLDNDGNPVDPSDPDCPTAPECPLDNDGNPVDPSDPDCPTAPECPLGSDGTPLDPNDPDCPAPEGPTTVPDPCPLGSDGTPLDPNDPDCPAPTGPTTPTTPPAPPTTPAPTTPAPAGPTLPVTGSSTMVYVLGGFWLLAAGAALVAYTRRPVA